MDTATPDNSNPTGLESFTLEGLRDEYRKLQQRNLDLMAAADKMRENRRALSTALMEAVEEYDLCEKYDEWVAEWNANCALGWELETRTEEFQYSVTITVTGIKPTDADENEMVDGALSDVESAIESAAEYADGQWEVQSVDWS